LISEIDLIEMKKFAVLYVTVSPGLVLFNVVLIGRAFTNFCNLKKLRFAEVLQKRNKKETNGEEEIPLQEGPLKLSPHSH
jgi:hypothetical protein